MIITFKNWKFCEKSAKVITLERKERKERKRKKKKKEKRNLSKTLKRHKNNNTAVKHRSRMYTIL